MVKSKQPHGPPMTLGNMRTDFDYPAGEVRAAHAKEGLLGRIGGRERSRRVQMTARNPRIDLDGYPDDVPVPWFGPRMACTHCGIIGADARPNWKEQPPSESLTGKQWR